MMKRKVGSSDDAHDVQGTQGDIYKDDGSINVSENSRSRNNNNHNNNNNNRSTSSILVLLIIAILVGLFIFSFYFIISTLFLASISSNNEEDYLKSNSFDDRIIEKRSNEPPPSVISQSKMDQAHLFLQVPTDDKDPPFCIHRNNLYENSEIIEENDNHNLFVLSNYDQIKHYQICLGSHQHQHTIRIDLLEGNCDVYLSTTHLSTPTHWDWKLNYKLSQKISIHSYAPEFRTLNDGTLFISPIPRKDDNNHNNNKNKNSSPHCHLNIQITEYSNEKLLHLMPALRGGKILLHRDIENMTHSS